MTLPPIKEWWPELSADARAELLADDAGHLGETAREEIREITGAVVGMAETLSDDDLDYLRSHAQAHTEPEKES